MKQIARSIFLFLLVFNCSHTYAQANHVIEPSILQLSYHVNQGKFKDDYILRIGKNVSQYFSYSNLRNDSLGSNSATAMIVLNEMLDEANNNGNESKQRPSSSGHGDYLYRNLEKEQISTYTQIGSSSYRIVEGVPHIKWIINEDSTSQILGFTCHFATTTFRGRKWNVWFTEGIPLPYGPWKLCGLPGIILDASSDGFITIQATNIKTRNLPPVTFYNFWGRKFEDISISDYLKARNNPSSYPKNAIITPTMELE